MHLAAAAATADKTELARQRACSQIKNVQFQEEEEEKKRIFLKSSPAERSFVLLSH